VADRAAGWFVAALLVLAMGVAFWWWHHDPSEAFRVTLSVLVATCPCALSLATPAAVTAATGALTRLGVLTTRGHALETLAQATHVVFDKTGTLTEGRLALDKVVPLRDLDADRSLAVAAALEQGSEHPVAQALRRAASPASLAVADARSTPGEGIEGAVQGRRYRIGTPEYVTAMGGGPLPKHVLEQGATQVVLGDEQGPVAVFVLADRLRSGAVDTVRALREMGLKVALLSGDAPEAVAHIARTLGIEEAHARLKPQDKLDYISRLQADGAVVAMVGDGVTDAPVLARAQVSLAMGSGTQLAQATADMVLLSEHLPHLAQAAAEARRTMGIIHENFAWAVLYNVIAVPAAAAGLVAPWMAAIGMSTSSLLVVLNALRLTRPIGAGRRPPRASKSRSEVPVQGS
ncbi:MAG: heavy metal translocating P-type ATPase, partial [Gammaproteobacteria bacterium]